MTELFYDKSVTCIACGQAFKTKRMRVNSVRIEKVDGDFCPHYTAENPLYYDVNVCPHCKLAFTDNFSPLSLANKERLTQGYLHKIQVHDLCGERTWQDALRSYELALVTSQLVNEKMLMQANLALRIAWLYRYEHRSADEQRFLRIAVDLYVKMYQEQNYDTEVMPDAKLMYIIAELFGRLKEWNKTKVWFSHLFTDQTADAKWRARGRDRWLEFKAMIKDETEDPEGYVGS